MFADQKDKLRKENRIRANSIEQSLKNNCPVLKIPMPAIGEAFCTIRDKCKDRSGVVIAEMNRLFEKGIVIPAYLHEAEETFNLASKISKKYEDGRDQISPMDALIVAMAASDKECVTLYTTDRKLISDITVPEIIDEWRSGRNYPSLKIKHISSIISR